MKQSSIFKAQKSMSSRNLCCASGGSSTSRIQRSLKNRIAGVKSVKSYRDYDGINGEPTEFEWNMFPGFTTLQLCGKINDLLSDLGQTPETFTGRILFMSMFGDISCDRKGNKDECLVNAGVVKVLARRFGVGQWSFIGPGSEKKWYSAENSPQGAWDNIAEEMLLEFAARGHPTFRATTPLSRGILKSKGHGKLSIHFAADELAIETIFRIIISVNQLSIYGAVAAICEEFENHQDGSGEPEILMGQSIVLGDVKAEAPLQNENPMNDQIIWQQYIQQVESLSPENKVSRFCMEAGFMRIVGVGQYFMTNDTGDFRQFRSVACREYTLPRDDGSSQPRGWIQGNSRIGPVLEVTTSYLYGKYGIEIRIWSVGQDNSQSWVRISHGSNKFVIDSNHNNTEVLADLLEEQASDTIKQYSEKKMEQFNSIELNFIFEIILHKYNIGLIIVGKLVWQQEEVRKEDISIALIIREESFTSELFKDTLEIISLIPRYRQRVDWNWNIPLHSPRRVRFQSSFNHQQWTDTWRSEFKQETDSILVAH